MNYEAEALATTLKLARERKGLSQRDLSALAGVPQSHISKIETAGVDLRISSLAALANALDLEIALIPRKAVPAVQSISRSVDITPQTLPEVAKIINGLAQEVERVRTLKIDPETLQRVQRTFKEIQQFQNLIRDPAMLASAREAIKTVTNSDGLKALRQSAQLMTTLRNKLAHTDIKPSNLPRRAYQLDGDDDA
ncbi:helix-turn-helix domain-containing protein [Sulfitobacter sp.]|jgi:transcriptional regulator with XRE-family HTH domain|uniref:helix-turn-helix domain-containing protein n=1 Tax=Sulfitobacter sp. TaxID=1903071 RepID=UPI00300119A7